VTAISAIGLSPVPANHVLGRKLDSIPFSAYHLLFGRETVGPLEAFNEAVPEPA
jgi:hypothetical protein